MADTPDMHWSQQSPIDIRDTHYAPKLPQLVFNYPAQLSGTFDASEHPNFILAANCNAVLKFEGKDCQLKKIHFHQPSEHKVAGASFAFEAHLIHKIPNYPEETSSVYVVVGVFFDCPKSSGKGKAKKRQPNRAGLTTSFADYLPMAGPNVVNALDVLGFKPGKGKEFTIGKRQILPTSTESYYRYEGSLTTPSYAEFVSWVVLKEHAELNEEPEFEIEKKTEQDARDCQPLNRRFVLRNFV